MRFIPKRLIHNDLFNIMFLLTVTIVISVSITITWTTIRMSERFFIEKFTITNSKVVTEIKDSFEAFNYSIVIASNNLLQSHNTKKMLTADGSNLERMGSIYNLGQQIKQIKSGLDNYEMGIMVTGENGVNIATDRIYWPLSDQQLKNHSITKNTLKQPKVLMYQYDDRRSGQATATTSTPPSADQNQNVIVASRALMDRITNKVYGLMYFTIPEQEFRNFYLSYTSPGNNVFVLNKSGVIVSSNQTGMIGEKATKFLSYTKQLGKNPKTYWLDTFMGKEQIILIEYLPSFDMYLVNTIDKKMAIGDLIDKKEIVLLSMGIVLIALIIVFLTTRRLTNSLSILVKQISNASKSNFHQYVSVTGTYETKEIGMAFNSMLDELHEYVNRLVLAQKMQRNAELAALQQQINPHFLYNTLTSIKIMVQQGRKSDTEMVMNALISLLQNTIGNISETLSVKEEMENLKNYVLINQFRYGNQIQVNYFLAPDCEEYQVPKLLLQPFVENSFFHGFNRKTEGFIHILVWKEKNTLICEVIDNGDGMEVNAVSSLPKTKSKRQRFSGIGVRNVHDRIQLIYGEPYGVTITSEPGNGTKVRITLPVPEASGSEDDFAGA